MLKGDLVSCRFQYGDEAMVKRGKAILKQTGAGIFSYVLFCLGGAYESYYRGANMGFTACIAVCAIAFIILGAVVSFIRKEYDYRKYNAHICLFVSLGLTIQIMVQGNLPPEKSTAICIISYVISIILGIWGALLTTGKIVINNEQYSIKKLNKNMCLNTFRIIDNKIYILSKTSNADNMNSRLDGEYTDNVIVLDKNSKSTLYIGEYMQGEAYRSESYILKNNEV